MSEFRGRTAQQFHVAHAFEAGAKCQCCSRAPVLMATVFAPLDEATNRGMLPPGSYDEFGRPTAVLTSVLVELRDSGKRKPFIRVASTYACSEHARTMKRAAAHAPSWCVVDFDEGPNPQERVQVQVAAGASI